MASNTSTVRPETAPETRQIVLKEIGAKRHNFSGSDLSAFKNKNDGATQVAAKYRLEKAQRDCQHPDEGPPHSMRSSLGHTQAALRGRPWWLAVHTPIHAANLIVF